MYPLGWPPSPSSLPSPASTNDPDHMLPAHSVTRSLGRLAESVWIIKIPQALLTEEEEFPTRGALTHAKSKAQLMRRKQQQQKRQKMDQKVYAYTEYIQCVC